MAKFDGTILDGTILGFASETAETVDATSRTPEEDSRGDETETRAILLVLRRNRHERDEDDGKARRKPGGNARRYGLHEARISLAADDARASSEHIDA